VDLENLKAKSNSNKLLGSDPQVDPRFL